MELGVTGVVGSVVQEHEEIRSKNLEKLGEPTLLSRSSCGTSAVLVLVEGARTPATASLARSLNERRPRER